MSVAVRFASPTLDLERAALAELRAGRVRIPPYPAVAAKLRRAIVEQHCGVAQIASIVGADASLAVRVLQREAAAPTLSAAIARIGFEELGRMALASQLGDAAVRAGALASLRRATWRRSLLAAHVAQELAPRRHVAPEDAYVAGLVHDFGEVVAISCLEELARVHAQPSWPATAWRELIAKLHVSFGAQVAEQWKLPAALATTIACHHAPETAGPHAPLARLVATCDQILDVLEHMPSAGVAALARVPGVDSDECAHIAMMLPTVVEQMRAFEPGDDRASSLVTDEPLAGAGWPCDVVVSMRDREYRACRITPDAIVFVGETALTTNWLVQLVLATDTEPLDTLANVRSCEPHPDGGYLVVAQPFALAGPSLRAWHVLVERARR